ncbi:MAG TPA: prenyltransferase/squalene oxidase repeat-containing protein [Acidobacteriaceae bacterium]|nr:prenyltransferase/squalene oxidase repeat-containing protein [Acidobacteriaceae bacterium]
MNMRPISRRQFVAGLSALPLAASLPAFSADNIVVDAQTRAGLAAFVEHHRKPGGGYGWISRTNAHITPTFAAVGCYRLLGLATPDVPTLVEFVKTHYPVPPGLGQQPLARLDYEQVQTLLWFGEKPDDSRAAKFTKPFVYGEYYEQNKNPTLQYQAMAVRTRKLLGLQTPDEIPAWKAYFEARRRTNGTFNNTPAEDGSGGHLMNTLWAGWAMEDIGEPLAANPDTVEWVRSCQPASGGFTWSPQPSLGAADNMIYTWAAISWLQRSGAELKDKAACFRWINEQRTEENGFRDRPGAKPNITATYYALDALRILGASLRAGKRRAPAIRRSVLPAGLHIYSAEIEAPGNGSPTEAVKLAEMIGIHIWTAKNSPPGWIAEAQRIAAARGTGVQIARGDEEYGTFTRVAGLGTYSHLDDLVAPGTAELGPYPPAKNAPHDWTEFRDHRIKAVRDANGRMVWQFNENEELTRILMDQAVADKSYGAISGFHFGVGDFLEFEPFLMSWEDRIAMVGLQDAHGGESWWWAQQLEGFRTLYVSHDPSWEGFVQAMDKQWMLAARHDATTNFTTQWTGALPEVRAHIAARENEWSWWGANAQKRRRPLAMLTVLRPGMKFEDGAPDQGTAVRVRLRFNAGKNPTRALQGDPESELVSMHVDGQQVEPHSVVKPHDRYLIQEIANPAAKKVTITVRDLATKEEQTVSADLV